MKAVILAGGRGTRLAEETTLKPKPLVEANGRPLIWHIMQNYSRHGISEFIVLSGYKGQQIREYFANFWLHQADLTFDLSTSNQEILKVRGLPWKVTVLDTGIDTNTGGRIARLKGLLEEDFLLTYGDGVSDIDIEGLDRFDEAVDTTLGGLEGTNAFDPRRVPTRSTSAMEGGNFASDLPVFALIGLPCMVVKLLDVFVMIGK